VDTLEAIQTLRSMRRYTDEPVSDEEIQIYLRAAVQAPNGGNLQPWRFLVVTDPQVKKGLAEIDRRAWRCYEPAVRASERHEFAPKAAQPAQAVSYWNRLGEKR